MRIRGAWAGLATTAVLGALSWMLTFGSTFALAASPAIEAESFFDIGSGSATLNAIVNAQSVLTSYVFEYGKSGEACFASSSCTRTSSASVGATGEGVGVSIQLGALESSTTYEFRAIASNASGDAANGTQKDLYPTIRQLPLLGVAWADLYRRTRVEETVFESLTGQYELAKVQEAREMPSVNVLDPADVPERKSGPPRTMIVLFLTFFVFAAASTWIWARIRWQNIDPADPGKMLTLEIAHTIRRKLSSLRTPGLRKMPTADSTNRDDRGSGLNGPSREE